MRVGELVKVVPRPKGWPGQESIFVGQTGVVIEDHSPMRPPGVGRVVDVLWDSGTLVDMYSDDLEIINERR